GEDDAKTISEPEHVGHGEQPLPPLKLSGGSGKEILLPAPPPLRTARAPFDACSSSIDQRTCYGTRSSTLAGWPTCTLLRGSRQRNRRGPHRQEPCAPPTFLLCPLKSVSPPLTYANTTAKSAGLRRRATTPIRSITDRPSLPPSSFTRSPVGAPCGLLSRVGGLRAYHVPPMYPGGLGRISPPVVRHPRRVSSEHANLTTCLLARSCQQ